MMELFHGTTKILANKIISTKTLLESHFDISDYLNYVIENVHILKFPFEYKIKQEVNKVKWLGKGVYAFGATDLKLAQTWQMRYGLKVNEEDCCAVKLDIPSEVIYECVDVTSLETRQNIIFFLKNELQDWVSEKFKKNPVERRRFLLMVKFLEVSVSDFSLDKDSYLIGIALEFYISSRNNKIDLVKGTFSKKNKNNDKWLETYYCVRNKEKISKYSAI